MAAIKHSEVKAYYNRRESRWGYKYLLKGTKHYGFYPAGRRAGLSLGAAQRNMERELGKKLALRRGSKVLDAGCGEGTVAIHLAQEFGYEIYGIDIIDWSIENAKRNKLKAGIEGLHFRVGDYTETGFPDGYFDGVYTMETLVHSPNYKKTLKEFYRVLKPGGVVVNHEYVLDDKLPTKDEKDWLLMYSECPMVEAFNNFRRSKIKRIWEEAGFVNVTVTVFTKEMEPFMRRLYELAYIHFHILKAFGREKRYVNTFAAVRSYQLRHEFQYTIIRGYKPK